MKLQRNRSLTKEEIDAYWRSKKQKEEEHLREISGSPSPRKMTFDDKEEQFMDAESETNLEKLIQTHGWYDKPNSFHLNNEVYILI